MEDFYFLSHYVEQSCCVLLCFFNLSADDSAKIGLLGIDSYTLC